jgi:hypothetical protein
MTYLVARICVSFQCPLHSLGRALRLYEVLLSINFLFPESLYVNSMAFNQADGYYDSYDNIEVHNLMLRDEPRVAMYKKAILDSKHLFKDKVMIFWLHGSCVCVCICVSMMTCAL